MTRLLRRLTLSLVLALTAVAVAVPTSLAVPVDPGDGTPYQMPRTVKKKKTRKQTRRPECRNNRTLFEAGSAACPVAG